MNKTLNGQILPLHLQVWAFQFLAQKVNICSPVSVQFLLEFECVAAHQLQRGFHIFLGVSNHSLHKTSISLKNKNSCPEAVSAHKSSSPVLAVHSKSLQTTPKTTFNHKTLSLCKVKCQQFRLNSFQGCFGKLKIHKTNVNSTAVTSTSGKISFKNCVKNEKYFN